MTEQPPGPGAAGLRLPRGGGTFPASCTAAGSHQQQPGSPPPSPPSRLPLLPAAGRTNPLGHGCKSNLVPPAPPPLPQSPVTAEKGRGTFPARPRGHAATEGVDGTADRAAARRQAHFLCPSLLPLPDSSGNCVITSCHRKPTSRRCKQTNTLCLHPSQNHPIGNERAGANGKGKANLKKKNPQIKPKKKVCRGINYPRGGNIQGSPEL